MALKTKGEHLMKGTTIQKTFGSIASIKTGYTFRGKIEEAEKDKGNAYLIQIKDLRKYQDDTLSLSFSAEGFPMIAWEGRSTAFTNDYDVILPARGGYFQASFLKEQQNGSLPVVVSSQFLVMTAKASVLPEFLCWSLNQSSMQRKLMESSQGTGIPMLKANTLKQLKLSVPSLATQQKIIDINNLWLQEQRTTKALLKNRETMLQGMYQQLLKETN